MKKQYNKPVMRVCEDHGNWLLLDLSTAQGKGKADQTPTGLEQATPIQNGNEVGCAKENNSLWEFDENNYDF